MDKDILSYEKSYSRERFWQKIKRYFRKAGYETVQVSLVLYYTARDPQTPLWCKSVIYGSLGYFVSMIDAIPDLTPVLGYTDDLGMMTMAVVTLARYITPEIRTQAKSKTDALFGEEASDSSGDTAASDH